MARFFNTAGPNRSEWHYTLPVLERLPEVQPLVDQRSWFVLHAPRQSGKTTAMRALAHELTASGRYAALHATCEAGAPFRTDPAMAVRMILQNIEIQASIDLPPELRPPAELTDTEVAAPSLSLCLSTWSQRCPLPVVLLLDEIDALQDDALIAVLRQIRAIYPNRPAAAPATVALIGLRDVRDYKVAAGGSGSAPGSASGHLGTASPFNIKVESVTLNAFTRAEVAALYGQHTAETGQVFSEAALDHAWALTRGQPWLVNALAREVVQKMRVQDTIEPQHIEVAKERLVLARSTHLDSLADKLNEPRVRRVIEPMLNGEPGYTPSPHDLDYCIDLGLVERRGAEGLVIANPIYREVLPRELLVPAADAVGALPRSRWSLPDGRLDFDGLLRAFVAFWKRNGEWMVRGQQWPESAHQLVLMAFLQRVVNGGGIIEREYGLGRGRVDLLVRWAVETDRWGAMLREDTHALELKVWRDSTRGDVLAEGLAQLDAYLDRLGAARNPTQPAEPTGTLVLFDARTSAPTGDAWEHRGVLNEVATPAGRTVRLLTA